MADIPRCQVPDTILREAGVRQTCYELQGNLPRQLRHGQVYTVDSAMRMSNGAISALTIPYEKLRPGPRGKLFHVDATDCETLLSRSCPDLDRAHGDDFAFDQGDHETHCRNTYFTAMATYELFRRALGRPVAWAFWTRDSHPALQLKPFAQRALNAYYDLSLIHI